MKKITALASLIILFSSDFSHAAISNFKENDTRIKTESSSRNISTKKELKKERRLVKITERIKKKIDKWQQKMNNILTGWDTNTYLYTCLGLLLVAILLFALSNVTVSFFSILGAFAFLGSLVFFVLWLLSFTGNL